MGSPELMDRLSRIFARTPVAAYPRRVRHRDRCGDRRRHRRHHRLGRHHQRPQGAAGPPARRGGRLRDPVPAARPRRDPAIAQRPGRRHHGAQGRSGDVQLDRRAAGAARRLRRHLRQRRALPGAHRGHPGARADVGGGRCHLRRHHRRHQQPAPPRDADLRLRDRRGRGAGLAAGRVRGAAAQTAGRADPADRRRRRGTRRRDPRRHRGRRDRRRGQGHAAAHLEGAGPHQGRAGVGARLRFGIVARTAHPADRHAHQPRGAVHPRSARGAAQRGRQRRHPHAVAHRGHADCAGAAGAGRAVHLRRPRPGRHHRAARPGRARRDAGLPRPGCVAGARAHGHHRGAYRPGCG